MADAPLTVRASETVLEHLNLRLFQWIHAGAGTHPLPDLIAVFFAESGPYLLVLLFVVLWFRSHDPKKIILIEATEATAFGLLLNQVIGLFYFHPRPFMLGLGTPLIAHRPETSFPSDHATFLFSATIYLLASRGGRLLGSGLFAVALLTAWGRVYTGLHFPFDIVGSLGVGTLGALFTLRLKSRLGSLNGRLVRLYGRSSSNVRDSFGPRKKSGSQDPFPDSMRREKGSEKRIRQNDS
jgi:undecaprenyl-diphosphatase